LPVLEILEDRTLPSFAAPVALDLGATPNAVAVGHFQGAKAPPDVVTANANGTVSVLLANKGDGSLANPITLTVGGSPDAVAVGDFLGNGLDDIAVANANGTVSVLLSNSNGTFAAPKTFSVGATPVGVAVGDFNGDGNPDLVTANSDGSVTALPGTGTGSFAAPLTSATGATLTSVAVGDCNGDHKPDLVVGTGTGLDVLLGKGDGTFQLGQTVSLVQTFHGITFQASATSVAVSDLRGNGKQDVVARSGVARFGLGEVDVLLGNGDGTLGNPVPVSGPASSVSSFVVGDFTGDGKPDIATSTGGGTFGGATPTVAVLVGKGDGTFTAAPPVSLGESATALAAGDFRGTGKLDLVLAAPNTVTVLPGNGNGTFATAPTAPANVLPEVIAAGDFNGDGEPDLVVGGLTGGVAVLVNNGNGTFHAGPTLSVSGTVEAVVVGDFNHDGKQDVAVGSALGTVSVFLGNGNGTFQAPRVFQLGGNPVLRTLVAGDFNRDGRLDLAVVSMLQDGLETSQVTVLLGRGNGTFAKVQTINVGTDAEGLAAADFNGDGKLDLVTTSFLSNGTRNVEVLLGNGNGTFGKPVVTTPGLSARFVATGDFNGDGKADLVLVDTFSVDNVVMVLPGNGNGTFGKPVVIKLPAQLSGGTPVVGDFFGDGHLSIAVATGQGQVTVLRGNGDGSFQAPVSFLTEFNGSQPSALAAADFNGDGKLDLAVTSDLAGDVSILLNTSPPPSHAAPVATSVTLTSDAPTVVFGQPVTLTATVAAASGTATGSVAFFDGTTMLGEVALDPNGQARLQVQLPPGTHSLKAVFLGTAPFTDSTSAAVSETVNKASTTTTLAVDNRAVLGSTFVILTATVAPVAPGAGTPTGTVTFMKGNTVLGTAQLVGGQAFLYLGSTLGPGKHTVTAIYSGDDDFLGSTAPPVTFTEL
jgi:hypothetical protein